jgi:hypothetical protein
MAIAFARKRSISPLNAGNACVDESLPCRWDVRDDTVTISVSYGQLDATFTGSWREDGTSQVAGARNPGADEAVNVDASARSRLAGARAASCAQSFTTSANLCR